MKIETLKILIKNILDKNDVFPEIEKDILLMIDLFEQEQEKEKQHYTSPPPGYRGPILTNSCEITSTPDEVPYGEICGCNPKNGGSGICGCVMGNKMVPNPKKYTHPVSNWGTTTTDKIELDPYKVFGPPNPQSYI